ncbi:unnamed protein product, partial [marine sediment metagenome]
FTYPIKKVIKMGLYKAGGRYDKPGVKAVIGDLNRRERFYGRMHSRAVQTFLVPLKYRMKPTSKERDLENKLVKVQILGANPGRSNREKAIELRESFTAEKSRGVKKLIIDLPVGKDEHLIYLGKCPGIDYAGPKAGTSKTQRWTHDFDKKNMPNLYTNDKKNILIIHGGKWKIKTVDDTGITWLVD